MNSTSIGFCFVLIVSLIAASSEVEMHVQMLACLTMVWHSSNALCPYNEVPLRWAGLVLGRVTACLLVNHLGM